MVIQLSMASIIFVRYRRQGATKATAFLLAQMKTEPHRPMNRFAGSEQLLQSRVSTLAGVVLFGLMLFADLSLTALVVLAAGVLLLNCLRTKSNIARTLRADPFVFLLLCSAVLSTLYTTYLAASVRQLALQCIATCLYLAFTRLERDVELTHLSLLLFSLAYSIRGLHRFVIAYARWSPLGFGDLSDFRAYVTLAHGRSRAGNENAAFICLLAICLIASTGSFRQRYLRMLLPVGIGLNLLCIGLSFSRGLELATVLTIVFYLAYAKPFTWTRRVLTVAFVVAVTSTIVFKRIVAASLVTALGVVTWSQRLSTTGRVQQLIHGLTLVSEHLWVGSGPGTYSIAFHEATKGWIPCVIGQPFNEVVNITVEQGLVGLLILSGLAAAVLGTAADLVVSSKTRSATAVRASLLGVSVYSFSQAFLFSNQEAASAAFVLLALTQADTDSRTEFRPTFLHLRLGPLWGKLCLVGCLAASAAIWPVLATTDLQRSNRVGAMWCVIRLITKKAARYNQDPYIGLSNDTAVARAGLQKLISNPLQYQTPSLGLQDKRIVDRDIMTLFRAREILPWDESVPMNLAWLYYVEGQYDAASANLSAAYCLCEQDYQILTFKGLIAEHLGNVDEARGDYSLALQWYPRLVLSRFWSELTRRNPLLASWSMKMAIASQGALVEASKNPIVEERLASLLAAGGEMTAAVALADQVAERLPSLAGAWELKGRGALEQGDRDKAKANLRRAAFLSPDDGYIQEELGEAEALGGDPNASLESFQRAMRSYKKQLSLIAYRQRLIYRQDWREEELRREPLLPRLVAELVPEPHLNEELAGLAETFNDRGDDVKAAKCRRLIDWSRTE